MIPPRPWRIARPFPYFEGQHVFIVDANGHAALNCSVAPDLAEFLVEVVNNNRRP